MTEPKQKRNSGRRQWDVVYPVNASFQWLKQGTCTSTSDPGTNIEQPALAQQPEIYASTKNLVHKHGFPRSVSWLEKARVSGYGPPYIKIPCGRKKSATGAADAA